MTRRLLVSCLVLLGVWAVPRAHADPRAAPDRADVERAATSVGDARSAPRSEWRFLVVPYGWLAGVNGTVVSGGEDTDLDIPFAELSERVNGGFQIYTEARWRRFFVAFDGTWASLGERIERPFLDVDVGIGQRLFDVRLGYELLRCSRDGVLDPCCEGWRRWVVVDAFAGARYWYTKQVVTVTTRRGRVFRESGLDERWDPFVGIRARFDLTRRLGLGVRADVGGFGLGDAAELTWQVQGGVNVNLTRWMHLVLGWRAIHTDQVEGTGAARSGAALTQQGPIVGLGLSF